MMDTDPTPTASTFNLSSSSGNRNPKDIVFQSYLSLPSQSSVSAPVSAVSPVSSSLLPPQPIPDMSSQLAPFANAGPAGVHHWTTTSISPQSQARAHYHHPHQYGQYPPQQQYDPRPSVNNHNISNIGSSPLATNTTTWNRSHQQAPPPPVQQRWSPTAPYAAVPPMGVWSETTSPVSRGRRM